jgi:dUTP pyrophosphatase
MISIGFMYTDGADRNVPQPKRESQGAAGWDVRANLSHLDRRDGLEIEPGQLLAVPTGLILVIPVGFECQIRSRSGLAREKSLFVLNSPGTVDSDFRGQVLILLANFGKSKGKVMHGDRVAQLVFSAIPEICMTEIEQLEPTPRADGGFGSTGNQ